MLSRSAEDAACFPEGRHGLFHDPVAVRELLVATARNGLVLTYSEALGALGTRFSRPKMRLLCRIIGDIDAAARAAGEPELAVLVVRASDGMPGEGWWRGQGDQRRRPDVIPRHAAQAFVKQRQAAAFAFWRGDAQPCPPAKAAASRTRARAS